MRFGAAFVLCEQRKFSNSNRNCPDVHTPHPIREKIPKCAVVQGPWVGAEDASVLGILHTSSWSLLCSGTLFTLSPLTPCRDVGAPQPAARFIKR